MRAEIKNNIYYSYSKYICELFFVIYIFCLLSIVSTVPMLIITRILFLRSAYLRGLYATLRKAKIIDIINIGTVETIDSRQQM